MSYKIVTARVAWYGRATFWDVNNNCYEGDLTRGPFEDEDTANKKLEEAIKTCNLSDRAKAIKVYSVLEDIGC